MKIGITGHTKNLGLSLFTHFSKDNEVYGYSRTTGYDVIDYKKIITDSVNCDVFINCVSFGTQQELATEWFEKHKGKKHLLVNISCSIPWVEFMQGPLNMPFDSTDKLELSRVSWAINCKNDTAKSVDIAPWILENSEYYSSNPISYKSVIKCVDFCITNYFDGSFVTPYICLS
jgi:hypothetical protein